MSLHTALEAFAKPVLLVFQCHEHCSRQRNQGKCSTASNSATSPCLFTLLVFNLLARNLQAYITAGVGRLSEAHIAAVLHRWVSATTDTCRLLWHQQLFSARLSIPILSSLRLWTSSAAFNKNHTFALLANPYCVCFARILDTGIVVLM